MFQDDDFEKLTYPVHRVAPKQIARLQLLPGVSKVKERDIAYLVYMYDLNSPFWDVADVKTRKEFAASKAGYDIDKDDLDDLYSLGRKELQEALVSMLRDQKSMEFTAMVLLEQLFYEYTLRLTEPLTDTDDQNALLKSLDVKGKLKDQLGQIIEQYKAYKSAIFGTNPEQIVLTAADAYTPENIAKKSRR